MARRWSFGTLEERRRLVGVGPTKPQTTGPRTTRGGDYLNRLRGKRQGPLSIRTGRRQVQRQHSRGRGTFGIFWEPARRLRLLLSFGFRPAGLGTSPPNGLRPPSLDEVYFADVTERGRGPGLRREAPKGSEPGVLAMRRVLLKTRRYPMSQEPLS